MIISRLFFKNKLYYTKISFIMKFCKGYKKCNIQYKRKEKLEKT